MGILKKGTALLAALSVFVSGGSICQAEIIPPYGYGQIGLTAAVLCETLTMREENRVDSATVLTLHYGDRIIVMNQQDGWAECVRGDAIDSEKGWVNADYLAIDPSWYKTDDTTIVYAWGDTAAPKVAQLSKDTTLPILKDDGEWLVVSLRGASGWIRK